MNTGLQRLYYQNLVDENGDPLVRDPNNSSRPDGQWQPDRRLSAMLGFSLKVIAMNDETEFNVRVRQRIHAIPADEQPVDPNDPPLEGVPSIRLARSYTIRTMVSWSCKLRGWGCRQRVPLPPMALLPGPAEDRILIELKYRFCGDTPNDRNAYLLVYLSDDPEPRDASVPLAVGECDDNSCCVAQVFAPQSRSAWSSIGSSEFATFFGEFDRGSLNFTRRNLC